MLGERELSHITERLSANGATLGQESGFRRIQQGKGLHSSVPGDRGVVARDPSEYGVTSHPYLQNRIREVAVLVKKGHTAFAQRDFEKAHRIYEEALVLAESTRVYGVIGDINLGLGVINQLRSRLNNAIAHYIAGMAWYAVDHQQGRRALVCFCLGIIHGERQDWRRGDANYERSLEWARESGDRGLEGLIYLRKGYQMLAQFTDTTLAQAYARLALKVFEALHDPLGQAEVYRLYGCAAAVQGAWKQAEAFYQESDRLHQVEGCHWRGVEV